jgi:hypothetical protein
MKSIYLVLKNYQIFHLGNQSKTKEKLFQNLKFLPCLFLLFFNTTWFSSLKAQQCAVQGPCGAAVWVPNNFNNGDTPGDIQCSPNGAQTQDNIPVNCTYNSSVFAIDAVCNPPDNNAPITWIKYQLPAGGGGYEFQIVSQGASIYYAIYYSNGSCTELTLLQCGSGFPGWKPALSSFGCDATQYFLGVWSQDSSDTNFDFNFKARKCSDICGIELVETEEVSCLTTDQCAAVQGKEYKVEFQVFGLNSDWDVIAPDACSISPTSFSLGDCGGGNSFKTITVYFPSGTNYSINLTGSCGDFPLISGNAPSCCTPFITCPPSTTFECDADLSPWLADYEVESCGINTIVENDFDRNDFTGCHQTGTRTITFVLKNATTGVELDRCTAILTIEDTGKPMIFCPDNAIVDCTVAIPQTGTATATDECDNSVDITSSDTPIAANCTGRAGISRTWKATDGCGNTSDCVQNITFKDETDPMIFCPANTIVDCAVAIPQTGTATATDDCDNSVDITSSDAPIAANCTGRAGISRTWKATDGCGNTSACVQTITFKDETNPMIFCPANAIVDCTVAIPQTGTATATDDCDNSVDITSSDVAITANCTGRAGISRTWKATDGCGNTSVCVQTITFKDETGPTGTCPILAYTVDCVDDLPCGGNTSSVLTTAINTLKEAFTDNCGGAVTVVADGNSVSGCVNNVVTLILYFKVKDACGNFATNRCEVKFTAPCDPFCTFTQGFWGNTGKHNGVSAPNIIAGLLLANGPIVIGLPGRSATIKTAKCVTMLLPSGGTAGQLASGNAVYMTCNNQTVGLNVLASQTIALQLNLWFNLQNGLNLGLYDLTDGCLNVPLPAGVITVNDLLALSNQVLGGCGCASASQVNNAINAINNYWDECQLSICSDVNLLTTSERTEDEVKNIASTEILLITPNPASEMISIDVSSFLDKKVEIVVFNVLGEMVWKKGITKVENELIQVPLGQFEEGIYPIILRDEANGKVYTARIVVQK